MRVLVTGGAGFLGSHVVEMLEEAGHEPVVLDDLSSGRRERVAARIPFIEADVRDVVRLERHLEECRPDTLVHLAARHFGVRESHVDASAFDVNVSGSQSVVTAAKVAGISHVVVASSAAVYGELCGEIADESHPMQPLTPNGAAKLAVEEFLQESCRDQHMATTILRFANLYGPGSTSECESAVHAFVERISCGESPVIDGSGNQTRDFVSVRDAAVAVAAVVESRTTGTFNVGTGIETSILELSTCVAEALGVALPTPRYRPSRPNDARRSCLDGTRLYEAVGFRPATELREGLAETVTSQCSVAATSTGLS
ncbi:MAG: NAD-dependent epimerase/dehydratase family protein [Blastocatellia bacterium]